MSEEQNKRTLKDIVADIEELLDETWRQADYLCSACQEFDESSEAVTTLYMTASTIKYDIYTLSAKLRMYCEGNNVENLDMFKDESEGEE